MDGNNAFGCRLEQLIEREQHRKTRMAGRPARLAATRRAQAVEAKLRSAAGRFVYLERKRALDKRGYMAEQFPVFYLCWRAQCKLAYRPPGSRWRC
jgi:hypothetical protein